MLDNGLQPENDGDPTEEFSNLDELGERTGYSPSYMNGLIDGFDDIRRFDKGSIASSVGYEAGFEDGYAAYMKLSAEGLLA